MLKKILALGMVIGMVGEVGAVQVPFDEWSGKYIVENIISSQEYPGTRQLSLLKPLLPGLIGGIGKIETELSEAWQTGFTVHDGVPENLKKLRDRIVDELCEGDIQVPHGGI